MRAVPVVIATFFVVIVVFYLFPIETKNTITWTGNAIGMGAKRTADFVQNSEIIQEGVSDAKDNVSKEFGMNETNRSDG